MFGTKVGLRMSYEMSAEGPGMMAGDAKPGGGLIGEENPPLAETDQYQSLQHPETRN
jgi:hypothetical protein